MKIKTFLKSGWIVIALLLLCNGARANVHLLGSPQVRRELKVSHAVSLQILHNLNLVARANAGGTMTKEQAQQQRELQKSVDAKALYQQTLALLSPSQTQRLRQIGWQSAGDHIWSDSEARQWLKLTPVQYQQLLRAEEREFKLYLHDVQKLHKANRNWFGIADRKRHAAKYAAYQRQYEALEQRKSRALHDAVAHVFTAEQKAAWKKLLGKPFAIRRIGYDTETYAMD